jgi:2'-5' RNA ligase
LDNVYTTTNVPSSREISQHTAMCIIPPYEFWEEIQKLNPNEHFEKWMPHINLFFGFVPDEKFYDSYIKLSQIQLESFEICLDSFGTFNHEKTITLFLKPNNESRNNLKKLHKILSKELYSFINSTSLS